MTPRPSLADQPTHEMPPPPPETNQVVAVAVTQEEEEDQGKDNDESSSLTCSPPPKRRRSLRNTQRLGLPHQTSLAYRRLEQFFFCEGGRHLPPPFQIRNLTLQCAHLEPHIYVIENFLKPAELQHFQKLIGQGGFQRSYVDVPDTAVTTYDTQHRTSTFLSFDRQHDGKIAAVEQRAADLFGCSTTQLEALQLVRYLPGQFFGMHHDLGDYDEETKNVALPPKSVLSKRRLATLFVYLNDCTDGCTYFEACQLRVTPAAGKAVLFSNCLSNGMPDPRTIHAGEAPASETKYGLNVWFCEE